MPALSPSQSASQTPQSSPDFRVKYKLNQSGSTLNNRPDLLENENLKKLQQVWKTSFSTNTNKYNSIQIKSWSSFIVIFTEIFHLNEKIWFMRPLVWSVCLPSVECQGSDLSFFFDYLPSHQHQLHHHHLPRKLLLLEYNLGLI